MNLFLSTRRLTSAKEDHLTEFLAAALEADRAFRDAYALLTNPCTMATSFACEHKIEASEAIGEEAGEGRAVRRQLERYRKLPIDGLAYLRSSCVTVKKR